MRGIYDLDDLDRSLYIHSTGQSDNPLSDLYDNFAERWGNVEYLPMTMRRDDIMAGALGTLRGFNLRVRHWGSSCSDPLGAGGYSNWELSSDRANASRRGLIDRGLTPDR
jgi:hypothetical protein